MRQGTLTVINEVGLHARPAAIFVDHAQRFSCNITVRNLTEPGEAVNAKSIIGILTIGVEQGHQIEITTEGEDEDEAFESLKYLIESDFESKL